MTDLYKGLEPVQTLTPPPVAPKAPAGLYDGLEVVNKYQPAKRDAQGAIEHIQAGWQSSAPGLLWRGKLPELVMNPDTASWWERALTGFTSVGAEVPLMIPGAMVGGPTGAAIGGAITGPAAPVGTAVGGIMGAGAGMLIVPGGIRESLIQSYLAGETKDAADWWNIVRETAKAIVKEGAIGSATFSAGAVARGGAAALMGGGRQVAQEVGLGTATMSTRGAARVTVAADLAGQIATMGSMPGILENRLPKFREFVDGGILIGGMAGAGVVASRMINTYRRTGKTPAEQVADAKADPKVAEELATPEVDVPRGTDGRIVMPTVQEALFREQARLSALEEKASGTPTRTVTDDFGELVTIEGRPAEQMTPAERTELGALRARVQALEGMNRALDPIDPTEPSFTPDQAAQARALATERSAALAARTDALTDAERAERVFLTTATPEALAKHFKLEPAGYSRKAAEDSAQVVHDDVLRQLRDADEARKTSGLQPLGEDHAIAVAALVRARVRTRAARLGKLPEEIYNEQPLQIRDETAAEVAAAEAAIPKDAPRFEVPEVDLFGDPVEPQVTPRFAVENLATAEIPLANLILSKEVPQFKHAADEKGVIVPLGGRFDRTGVGPIQVWERLDGTLEVISGRHRLDLARRSGEETIPAQIHREAEGFTARRAATLDAELNIREEQGSVADYAQYFKDSGVSKEAADERGLLARAKGRTGFAIARDGSPDLVAAHRAGVLSDEAALSISMTAPQSERLQALGIAMVNEGKSILIAVNTMKAVDLMAAERMAKGAQGDIFGFDDSAMKEASKMAKLASSQQRKISEQIAAVSGASKRPELAKKMGVDVQDPDGIQKRIVELRQEQTLWDNWPLHPELVARLRGPEVTGREGDLKQEAAEAFVPPEFDLKPETPAELAARNAEAVAQARRKLAEERAAELRSQGKKVTADQADLFSEQRTLFQSGPGTPWYSALERAVGSANMKQAPVQGWKEWLKGQQQKGVKAEEIKWSGLEEWLDLQEGKVTKAQVQEFLAGNGVKVKEVELGAEPADAARVQMQQALAREGYRVEYNDPMGDGEAVFYGPDDTAVHFDDLPDNLQAEVNRATAAGDDDGARPAPKYAEYQLPGAREGSYRELLLTLPNKEPNLTAREGGARDSWIVREENSGQEWEVAGKASAAEAMREVQDKQGHHLKVLKAFQSSHFDEPNILAHVRFNERTDAEGKRVLFIEEIQSDWAQKGKKEGFKSGTLTPEETELQALNAKTYTDERLTDADRNRIDALIAAGVQKSFLAKVNGVPSAPFVGKTEAWVGLSLKRMIRYAAENGFERIAWTRGEQQVDRYTGALRKAVDAIEWTKTPDGVQLVGYKGTRRQAEISPETNRAVREAMERNDNLGFDDTNQALHAVWTHRDWATRWEVAPEDIAAISFYVTERRNAMNTTARDKVVDTTEREDALSDAIGKAMADRILNDPAQSGTIEGENIKVDDTGMATFYDRIVPMTAKKVLRSLGVSAHAIGEKSEQAQVVGDRALADLQPVRDLALSKTFLDKGFEGLSAKSKRLVQSKMLALGKDDQVLQSIVRAIPVDVVNMLQARQLTPEMFFHDPAMLVDNLAAKLGTDVPGGIDVATALVRAVASVAAERMPAGIDSGLSGAVKGDAAIGTGRHGDIVHPVLIEGAEQQGFSITPAMRDKAMEGMSLFQEARASYNIAQKLITTLQKADKSSIVHELGHDWMEEMKADASRPDAPAQIKADWELLRKEFAIPEEGDIPRGAHEQAARSFERYLGEGTAPSAELRGVFARFKQWMLEIYESLGNLKATVNPELRAIFDRMLATDAEIADARELNVPRAYVAEAKANEARKIVPGFKAEQVALEPYADELPKGPGEAPDNSHVNYAYINSPLDVKLTMQRMAEIDQANIQKQRGGTDGVKSWEDANAEQARYINDILGGGEDTLRLLSPRDPNAAGPDVKLGILKKLAVGAAKDSARLRDIVLEAGHDATIRQQLEYMGSIERARMIQAEFLGERAGVARALNALKDVTEGSGEIGRMLDAIGYGQDATLFQAAKSAADEQAILKAKLDEILLSYKGKSVLDIAKLHKEIGTLKGTFKFSKEVTRATTWEMIVEGWKASLLSGPVTHTTNLFGTQAFMAMRAPVDLLASVIGMARGASPGMGESDRASMSEAVARLTGMLGGVKDGLRVAKATFDLDDPTGKTEAYRTAIPGRAGELIRIPLRLMGATDAVNTTMFKRGELATLAIRKAFDENLNPNTREFAERVTHLKDNPTPEMQAAAEAAAARMTFNMPLGEKGVYLQLFVNKWNLQWMLPFIRTPINIMKEVGRMTPFAPVVGEWRAAIAKGGVERDKAIAEMALGSGIMALTMAYVFSGDVSGGGDADPGKNRGKAGVWQPYSIKIGNTWYEYTRIEPTGTLMGMAADMATVWDHMNDEEKDKLPKLLSRAFANAVTNKTFLQGITNVVNAMSDPGRFAPSFLKQMAGSLVPNVIGQPTAMADPVVREVNSMLEAIQARLPGLRQNLTPDRDWLGAEKPSRERVAVIAPVRKLEISEDKVRQEAAKLDISIADTPKKTHIGKGTGKLGDVELTPEERDKYAQTKGEMAHKILSNIVQSPGYDQLPDLIKRRIFSKVLTASSRVAAVAALPMDKRVAHLQSISERMAQELTAE